MKVFLATAAAVALLAGCQPKTSHTVGKYEQTWTTSYGATTCGQWTTQMTDHQQFVAAHDMDKALKAKDLSDTFAKKFQADVTTGCTGAPATMKMAEIAAGIATIATGDFN